MRSDAALTRRRTLSAAVTALGESSDATMNSIAKRAGVGQGTMYRHFPNREALLLAVYRQDVQAVIDAAPALLGQYPPDQALRRWFGRLASYGRIKHGAGQAAGQIRGDVDADEVLLLVGFLWRLDNDGWEKRAAHLLDLVMDGLRPA